jgi:hypothetical protein
MQHETPVRIHRRVDRRFLAIPGPVDRVCDGVAVMKDRIDRWDLWGQIITVRVAGAVTAQGRFAGLEIEHDPAFPGLPTDTKVKPRLTGRIFISTGRDTELCGDPIYPIPPRPAPMGWV